MANRAARGGVTKRQKLAYSTQAMMLNDTQERVLRNARCTECGSSDFTQTKA
jgi:hypothetical protein